MASQQRLRVTGINIGLVMREHMRIIEALKAKDAEASVAAVRGAYRSLDAGCARA